MSNRNFLEGKYFEEQLIQAILLDNPYGEQMMEVLDVDYFTQDNLKYLAKLIYKHYQDHKTFQSIQSLEGQIKGDPNAGDVIKNQCAKFFNRVRQDPLVKDLQRIKEASLEFCRKQKLLIALEECLDMTETKNYESIVGTIQTACAAGSEKDFGHVYEDKFEERMTEASRKPVATPWEPMNRITAGGLSAGELAVVLALTGVGKSHVLVDVGAAAALSGLNVLHFTFELSELRLGKRYDARISGIPYNDLLINKEYVKECVDNLKGTIRIKKYANRKGTTQTIRNYVNRIKIDGVYPDLIIVDYADIMKSSKAYDNKRFEEEAIYEELVSLAEELKLPIWTASQTNRSGMDAEVLTLKHIAECFAKANTADLFITMNRKKNGNSETMGNFFVAKNRLGDDGVTFNAIINTALSQVTCLQPDSDEEKRAIATFGMGLKNGQTEQARIRKEINSMREQSESREVIEDFVRSIQMKDKPNGAIHQNENRT